MAVYFKFKSAKDYDSVSIDGHFISVGNLKDKIVEKKNLDRGTDFDLLISNAQTNEEYTDEAQSVPKNTSVLVRRVPGRRQRPIVAEVRDEKVKDDSPKVQVPSVNAAAMPLPKQADESEWGDEFGVDLYSMPESSSLQKHLPLKQQQPQQQQQLPQQVVTDKSEEDIKIKAFVDASASDWQRQTQESLAAGRGFGRGQGRGFAGRGYGRSLGSEKRTPPPGYVCHRCGIAGHFIQHCDTNGNPAYDVKKMKPPTGIPKSMLVANPDGSYALPSGTIAVLRPNEAVFKKEVEGLSSSRNVVDVPFEFCCPLCKGVLKDAVLTSRCCFESFCDKCIRNQFLSNGTCVCGATNVLADDLKPNKTLREAITRLLETSTATSSADQPGSLHIVQDTESAQRPKHRAPSPSVSGSQRLKARASSPSGSWSQKNGNIAVAPVSQETTLPAPEKQPSLVINIKNKGVERLEQTAESVSRQEPGLQDVPGSQTKTIVEEEVPQETVTDSGKKKKLKPKWQKPLNGEKEGYYPNDPPFEQMIDGGMIRYAGNSAFFGNFWAGPQYIADAFGQPLVNPQYPVFGYGVPGPAPCDMLYGAGLMVPEPLGHPACVPALLPIQRDEGVMSREEFEARKADLKRKRELEERSQRRNDTKGSESGDSASVKIKRSLKMSNKAANIPPYDVSDKVEKPAQFSCKKSSAASQPEAVKSKRNERREDTLDHPIEDRAAFETSEKLEKKPKGSVFSRISFPAETKDRPKQTECKDEAVSGIGLKNRSMLATSSQDSVKFGSGRKPTIKDDRLRIANRVVTKGNLEDEVNGAEDDDAYDCNFRHGTSYSTSPQDGNIRIGKRRRL